jgi:hypothetical protein
LVAFIAGSDAGAVATGPSKLQVEQLYGACVDAMVRSTCVAMNEGPDVSPRSPGEVVFVVGVGRIDAASYRRIRAYGESMCGEARRACQASPDGHDCHTAIALWGHALR